MRCVWVIFEALGLERGSHLKSVKDLYMIVYGHARKSEIKVRHLDNRVFVRI